MSPILVLYGCMCNILASFGSTKTVASGYATTKLPDMPIVAQQELILEHSGLSRRIRDIHGNDYRTLEWHEIRDLTWKGKPFLYEPATSTARPGDDGFSGATEKPIPNVSFSAWTTGRQPHPPRSTVHESDRQRGDTDESQGRRRMMEERPSPRRDNQDEFRSPRFHRTLADELHRKVRPSALQKMVKRYDGSGDPHDHVAAYRQAVHAEQVSDTHTQIEGFGLTLESKALTWFKP